VLLTVGCATSTDSPQANPWEREFQRVYTEATTDFVREIVANGELTLAEMREAAVRTGECYRNVGSEFRIEEHPDGSFGIVITLESFESMDDATSSAAIRCELDYWNELWLLWDTIRASPEGLDRDVMVVECLNRHGVTDEELTVHQFREAAGSCAFSFEEDPNNPLSAEEIEALAEEFWLNNRDCRPQLPNGVYLDAGQAWDCQMDPNN